MTPFEDIFGETDDEIRADEEQWRRGGLDMTTRTIDLADATQPLADYAEQVDSGSIVVTKNGQPIAAIVALPNTDLETASLSQNPQFLAIIERSRGSLRARFDKGGISSAEMRRRLGVAPSQTEPASEP